MNKDLRMAVSGCVIAGALLIGWDWPSRFGIYFLVMAFIVTIDMTGGEK